MSITPEQILAARAMLRWSRKDAADAAGIAERTLIDFERKAERSTRRSTMELLRRAFEDAGIEFFDGPYSGDGGPGVRRK